MQTSANPTYSGGVTLGQGSKEYCLRWSNHQPNLVSFFGNLFTDDSFVDVTLVSSEGKRLQAHKLVLSACSPYFQAVFANNPCKHPVVILKDVQYSDLHTIVKFIYKGEVNITQDRIGTILQTATSLQVKGLADVRVDELNRVSLGVSETTIPSNRSHQVPPLTSSASWSLGDTSDQSNEIPRKKLRKSASAAGSYGVGSNNINGDRDPTGSVDSGVGASVSRSIDEGASLEEMAVMQKRSGLPAPPPLLPKSRSLDHTLQRDNQEDTEMNARTPERQSYDDSSIGMDRGHELEVADLKIDTVSDDGEIECLEEDEEYDEETYGRYPTCDYGNGNGYVDPEPNEMKQSESVMNQNTHPQFSGSSTSLPLVRQPLRVSSAAGEKRRRGRPLLRQPRIKRGDNELSPGGGREQLGNDLYIREPMGGEDNQSNELYQQEINVATANDVERRSPSLNEESKYSLIHKSNLPIVRVSQCSPTPPSSPPSLNPSSLPCKDGVQPVIVSTYSSISFSSSNNSGPPLPSSSMIITPASQPHVTTTLLTVPSTTESQPHSSIVHSSSGSHLVKQISQPLLPSHTLVPVGGITTGNPVIRRQYSTPIPGQQSRIIQSMKQGAVLHFMPSSSERFLKEEEGSKTYIIDVLPSPTINVNKDIGNASPRRELKREGSSEQSVTSGSFSREDSVAEEIASTNASLDDGLPVNRSGHCPVLRPGPALGCNFCWNSTDNCGRVLRRKTKYHCPECHINLCIVPCFQEYHEKADKKKKPRSKLGLPKPSSME